MNRYYVYEYIDPRTMKPFYVGKGSGDRMYHHLNESWENTQNKKKYRVIKNIRNNDLEPIVQIHTDNLTEHEAYALEANLIRVYGRRDIDTNGLLTNICEDNRPPSQLGKVRSAETKEKMSISSRKENLSDDTIKKMSVATKSRGDEWKKKLSEKSTGRIKSDEEKNAISARMKINNPTHDANVRKKISESLKFENMTDEDANIRRQKMSSAQTGKKLSDDTKKKIGEARKGRKFSEETLRKMSEKAKLREQLKREQKK